ncbi:MAG: magnesium transporter [Anaerolineae bacterium]|jgi:magnesium transporter
MKPFVLDDVLAQLRDALKHDDLSGAEAIIKPLQPADQADLVEELADADQLALLSQLAPADSADVLEEMNDRDAAALAELLPLVELADILDEMEADEAADVLGDLSPTRATEALREMEEPGGVIPLLQYPDDTAGGLMMPAIITLRRDWTAQRALKELRRVEPEPRSAYYLFVTDRTGVLLGVVGLRDLVVALPETTVEAMMDPNVIAVPVTADQELCARTLSRYGFLALPVVDAVGRLVGVITADDLIEVAEDEATEDMYRMVGISGEEQVLGPLRDSVLKRLPWLVINMITLFVAITVVDAFEAVIAGMVALATFLPLVSGEGGNAGSQTTTVIVRALALGEVNERDGLRALTKEMIAALINGAIVGLCTGLVIFLWKGEWVIALAATLAMTLNFLVAALAGVLVPLGLKLVKVDPALASAAFVTGVTDTLGFLFFLGIATLLM